MRQLPVWWGCVALVAGCAGGGGAKDAAGLPDVVETQAELAEPDAAEAVPEVDVCLPQCAGKVCGEDGCGGQCGTCAGKQDVCANGLCVCQPDCSGKACGDDGCGGSCGTCLGEQMACVEGACVCQPECAGKECGSDGCNGSCGQCAGPQDECVEGKCVCQPACEGKNCGPDGCNGVCGECTGAQEQCLAGMCTCVPACESKVCGEDGCGGVCGECPAGDVCFNGACCTPQCAGKECGDDACGAVCGLCPGPQDVCQEGLCVCIPDCEGKVCGSDGCDGSCGDCLPGDVCFLGACCTPDCTGKVCGDNICGGFCGNGAVPTQGCPAFQDCQPGDTLCQLYPKPDLCGDKQCGADGIGGACGWCPCVDCLPSASKCEGFQCTVPEGLECYEIFDCFGGCTVGDQACYKECVAEGTVDAQMEYNDFITCLDQAGYFDCAESDQECIDEAFGQCMDPYYVCFHGDESCSVLYVCLMGCPGGDTDCTNGCFTSATIDALATWDLFIDCLDAQGYYECFDQACYDAAWAACHAEFLACANGPLDCKEVFGCIQACDYWDSICRVGCRVLGTAPVQDAIDDIAACVEDNCFPVTGFCEQEVLVGPCQDVYSACLAL